MNILNVLISVLDQSVAAQAEVERTSTYVLGAANEYDYLLRCKRVERPAS